MVHLFREAHKEHVWQDWDWNGLGVGRYAVRLGTSVNVNDAQFSDGEFYTVGMSVVTGHNKNEITVTTYDGRFTENKIREEGGGMRRESYAYRVITARRLRDDVHIREVKASR